MTQRLEALRNFFRTQEGAAIAFSGGVDSTFLLKIARDVLGDKVIAVTVCASIVPERESEEAAAFCGKEGIRHIRFQADVLAVPGFRENPKNRCYICKKELFGRIVTLAAQNGIHLVCEGSNASDESDYRPGMKAVRELGVRSPLLECGLRKDEIRILSRELGLPTWDKPSFACLASRFPYGELITEDKLGMVARAEEMLHGMGFRQLRVRIHGDRLARIEAEPGDMEAVFGKRELILDKLKELGFAYVSLDLQGYRTGSMNEVI